ncbi:DUF6518 family protein [Micromonospora okii]|uniref:DUF6518 family protein n=1 Tax=Micromonospora okii TaxID=1182970 RepID=UPI001E329329|nr:DUF6518 family protein [Micromonospora okii]
MSLVDRKVALAAVVGGLLLGSLDFVWIKFVPYPLAELGNSTATWAIAAFFFGWWVRSGWLRAALGAAVLLVLAVPSYYLAATLIQGDDLAIVWGKTALLWMLLGVLTGLVFGVGGVWARAEGWRAVVGLALPAAVLLEEATRFALRLRDPSYSSELAWNVAIDVALALLLVALLGRTHRQRALALAVSLPMAAVVLVAFAVFGAAV